MIYPSRVKNQLLKYEGYITVSQAMEVNERER